MKGYYEAELESHHKLMLRLQLGMWSIGSLNHHSFGPSRGIRERIMGNPNSTLESLASSLARFLVKYKAL